MPNNPVSKADGKFIRNCVIIALCCYLGVLYFREPGIVPCTLLVITIIAIGAGTLRLMHVIRDL